MTWSDETVGVVTRMLLDGVPHRDIAKAIGSSRETVRRKVELMRAEGAIDGDPPSDPEDVRRIPAIDPLLVALRAAHGRSA